MLFLSVFSSRVYLHRYEAYNGIKIYSKKYNKYYKYLDPFCTTALMSSVFHVTVKTQNFFLINCIFYKQ
jgi:hypothetical protein